MSKINCNIAGDLIPLYVDKILCRDSEEMLEEHLTECESCTAKVETLRSSTVVKTYDNNTPLKKFRRYMFRHRVIIGAVTATALVMIVGMYLLFSYLSIMMKYYSYDEVKDGLTVASYTDYTDEGIIVTYEGEHDIFSTDAVINVVGERNGRPQVELTFHMQTREIDRRNFTLRWNKYYNANKPHLVFIYTGESVSGSDAHRENLGYVSYPDDYEKYNVHSMGYGCNGDIDIDEYEELIAHMEIVRIYYGKETDSVYNVDQFIGQRHLLWEKKAQ